MDRFSYRRGTNCWNFGLRQCVRRGSFSRGLMSGSLDLAAEKEAGVGFQRLSHYAPFLQRIRFTVYNDVQHSLSHTRCHAADCSACRCDWLAPQ